MAQFRERIEARLGVILPGYSVSDCSRGCAFALFPCNGRDALRCELSDEEAGVPVASPQQDRHGDRWGPSLKAVADPLYNVTQDIPGTGKRWTPKSMRRWGEAGGFMYDDEEEEARIVAEVVGDG
jgi:hypothetical protein